MINLTRMNLLIFWNLFLTLLMAALLFWTLNLENGQRNLTTSVEYNRNILEVHNTAINVISAEIVDVEWKISRFDDLEWRVPDLEWRVADLEWDMDELKRDVDSLEWDIWNLQNDIRMLKLRL